MVSDSYGRIDGENENLGILKFAHFSPEGLKIFEEMDVPADAISTNAVIQLCSELGDFEKAEKLLKRLEDDNTVNALSYGFLFANYVTVRAERC